MPADPVPRITQRVAIILLAAVTALTVIPGSAGAAGFEDSSARRTELHNSRIAAAVGKTFWIYFGREDCRWHAPKLREQPNIISTRYYKATTPTKVTLAGLVQPLDHLSQFYKVLINDNAIAYVHANTSPFLDIPADVDDLSVEKRCVLPFPPEVVKERVEALSARRQADAAMLKAANEEEVAAAEALRMKPGAKIGMIERQVIEETSWGKPIRVNRTTTAKGQFEQWVYEGNRYLYFTDGKLTAIQD